MTRAQPPIERHSVVLQVRQRLRQDIVAGRLAENTLYSVAAIAEELGVSRTPVREALLQLSELGLVEFHRNRGFTVVSATIPTLVEIFQIRLALETAVARRAAGRVAAATSGGAPVDLSGLRKQLDALSGAAVRKNRDKFMQADRAFHEELLALAANERVHNAVTVARDALFNRGLSASGEDRTWADLVAEHQAIHDAVAAGRSDQAARCMGEHLVRTATALAHLIGGEEPPRHWAEGWF